MTSAPSKELNRASQMARFRSLLNADSTKGSNVTLKVANTNTAMTGKTDKGWEVILPSTFDVSKPENGNIVYGMVVHEDGHHLYTEMEYYQRANSHKHGRILVHCLNLLDDIQQEHAKRAHRPGDTQILHTMYKELIAASFYKCQHETLSAVFAVLHFGGHLITNGYTTFEKLFNEQYAVLEGLTSQDFAKDVRAFIPRIPAVKDTADAYALAMEIITFLFPDADDQESNDPQSTPEQNHQDQDASDSDQDQNDGDSTQDKSDEKSNSDSNDDGQDGSEDNSDSSSNKDNNDDSQDGNSSGDSDADSKDDAEDNSQQGNSEADSNDDADGESGEGTDSDGEGDSPKDEPGTSGDSKGSNPDQDGSDTSDSKDDDSALQDADDNSESGKSGDSKSQKGTRPSLDPNGKLESLDAGNAIESFIKSASDQGLYDENRAQMPSSEVLTRKLFAPAGDQYFDHAQAKQSTGGLTASLRAFVESLTKTHRQYRDNGKRIARRKIAGAIRGDTRFYTRKDEEVGANTAVSIVVDRSGSMQVLLPGDTGATRMKVANEVAYALSGAIESINGNASEVYYYNSFSYLAKPFSIRTSRACGNFNVSPTDGTHLYLTLNPAILSLIKQPQKRKLLIIVTDGETSSPNECAALIRGADMLGIDVYGLAIGNIGFLKPYLPVENCVQVTSALGLRDKMFELARQSMSKPPRG